MHVRKSLALEADDRVAFVKIAPGRYEFVALNHDVRELKGMFGKPSGKVSIDAMNPLVAKHQSR